VGEEAKVYCGDEYSTSDNSQREFTDLQIYRFIASLTADRGYSEL